MLPKQSSSVRSRQVSAELQRLRSELKLTGAEVARILGMSPSKLSRMETGHRGLNPDDVSAVLGLYRVPERRREALLDLVRRSKEESWWQSRRDNSLTDLVTTFIEFESRASRIRNFELAVVPGLLQIAEYSAAVIGGLNPGMGKQHLDNLVATRMARQSVLRHSDLSYEAIVDESALRRLLGNVDVAQMQLRHLLIAVERPNVSLRVVPTTSAMYAGIRGAFVLFDFPDEPSIVHVEHQYSRVLLEEKAEISAHRTAWQDIEATALPVDGSIDLITQLLKETTA